MVTCVTQLFFWRSLEVACNAEWVAELNVSVSESIIKAFSAVLCLVAGAGFAVRGAKITLKAA